MLETLFMWVLVAGSRGGKGMTSFSTLFVTKMPNTEWHNLGCCSCDVCLWDFGLSS